MSRIHVALALLVVSCGKVSDAGDAASTIDGSAVVDATVVTDAGDPCFPNPCLNGGTCAPAGGTFACTCTGNYAGVTCESLVGPVTFAYNGAMQSWTVPAGVTAVDVDARGASGGDGWNVDGGGSVKGLGGNGGRAQARLVVTPGEPLFIFVGGAGQNASTTPGMGGFNGGGNGADSPFGYAGGGGGGATDLRRGGAALTDRILVASGGGSGSGWCTAGTGNGGVGGGLVGATGQICVVDAGTGGSQSGGGIANGAFGVGGSTGLSGTGSQAGSAGGGGWYGGGANNGSGGGGGSSYVTTVGSSNIVHTQGAQDGNGSITFSW